MIAFLFLGTGMIQAEEFHLSQENEKLLAQINDMLLENDDQPLTIIVDGKNVNQKKYWKAKDEKEYCLKINTNAKNIELKQAKNNSLVIVIGSVKIKQLKKSLLKDLNKTQSVNKSLNNFLKDLKEEIYDEEKDSGENDTNDALETACWFILGLALLALVMIAFSS